MSLTQIGGTPYTFQLQKRDGRVFQIAAKEEITVTRSPNEASKLTCQIPRNTPTGEMALTAENGEIVALKIDVANILDPGSGHEMFFGYVFNTTKNRNFVTITAVDQLGYMAKNQGVQPYGDIKLSELLKRICEDYHFHYDANHIKDTEYVMKNLVMDGEYLLDFIKKGIERSNRHTHAQFYIRDAFNKIVLQDSDDMAVTTFQVTQRSIQEYDYEESVEGMVNSISVQTQNDDIGQRKTTVLRNEGQIGRYGTFGEVTQLDEGQNADEVARDILKQKEGVQITLTVSGAQGDPRVWGGSPVWVDLFSDTSITNREYIRGWFRCESVTHKITNATHTMDMKLSLIEMYDNWEDLRIGKHKSE